MRLRAFVTAVGLVAPALSLAQAYCDPRVNAACYQAWCRAQGGTPVYRGNWGCQMSSGGGYSGGSGGAELGQQIGGVLGALIREGLFGNPQQDAQRQAAMEEQRRPQELENQRRAEEQARQDEARYERLRASLLDFNPAPPLSLMGTQPGSGGLQLLMGDEAERSSNPALAELSRAAAWSTLAARASTAEDAAALADAAFQSLVGGKVDLPPPPPDVKGVPVHPMLPEVDPLKKQYLALQPQVPDAMKPVLDAERRRATFQRLEAEALAMERASADVARKAQAREAARQARELREKAEADLRLARTEFERLQLASNQLEQALRAWLSAFAAGERKEDSYYYLGFEDGSQCFSQNAGPRCDKARAPAAQFENCLASYRRGHSAGETLKKQLLDYARGAGERDGHAGMYEISDPRANGPCRYDFVMAYNRGYFGQLASVSPATRSDVPVTAQAPRRGDPDVQRVVDGIMASAKRMGWTIEEQARLGTALHGLPLEGVADFDPKRDPERIRGAWADVQARASNADVVRDAARSEGPGLFGAGTQTGGEDCAIFALASAAGQPYGVVAARAADLIGAAEWRSAGDRADPASVIKKSGLNGGEVVMLAEAFGRAEVVKPSEFAQALRAGRPVMVNVVPQSGDIDAGHQLVLAKTFQRSAETWYEVIDSNAGPMRRLYMNAGELELMIREEGIAFAPEPGRTPRPLRARR